MQDVRFEIEALDEPDVGATHFVAIIDNDTGETLETHITDNPYGMVEAHREVENMPSLEDRLHMEYERECREYRGW